MQSVTIYFKDRENTLTINDVVQILAETDNPHAPFAPVSLNYMFFDDNKKYVFNGKKHNVFIRGSEIQCVSVSQDC